MTDPTDPTVFPDRELRQKVLTAQHSYHRSVMFMVNFVALCVLALLGVVVYELREASKSRQLISDCIQGVGPCAERSEEQLSRIVEELNRDHKKILEEVRRNGP